jgi:hypothetical protein
MIQQYPYWFCLIRHTLNLGDDVPNRVPRTNEVVNYQVSAVVSQGAINLSIVGTLIVSLLTNYQQRQVQAVGQNRPKDYATITTSSERIELERSFQATGLNNRLFNQLP